MHVAMLLSCTTICACSLDGVTLARRLIVYGPPVVLQRSLSNLSPELANSSIYVPIDGEVPWTHNNLTVSS